MKIAPHYVTYIDFPDLGLGHGCDPATFDDAVDAYAEALEKGYEAAVFCVSTSLAGTMTMTSVTAEAMDKVKRRCMERDMKLPEWLEEVK